MAAPMPLEAPVTTATLPASFLFGVLIFGPFQFWLLFMSGLYLLLGK